MRLLLILILSAVAGTARAAESRRVHDLRCEYLEDPSGIDVERPRLGWTLPAGPPGRAQSAYRVLVASSPGKLARHEGDLWDSGKVTSPRTTWVPYGGRPLASGERVYWKVEVWDERGRSLGWSAIATWSMGLLRPEDWRGRFIGLARPPAEPEGTPQPFPWLRKAFELPARPARATIYVNALGYYELHVNGRKVDDHVLSPRVTDYAKRTFYVTHDITRHLSRGKNVVALWLGRGWYVRGHPGVIHDGPLVRAQLDVELPGGGVVEVETGPDWKVEASPTRPLGRGTAFGDYGGERHDARLDLAGWSSVGLDDSGWAAAAVFDPPPTPVSAQMVEPNRILGTLRPVKIEERPPGEWHIDMGRNFVGWLEVKLPPGTRAGQEVRIEYADQVPPPGKWSMYNQRDEHVTRAGAQTIRSRFNYHGFRYAHITGLDRRPAPGEVTGHFIRTAYRRLGDFESSNELLNRIYRTVAWTYENLTLGGYVVDCPTRERLGYGGDAGTSIETGLFNFDVGALYGQWAVNWRDAQAENGDLPYTAPAYPDKGGGGPMWSGFVVTLPWHVYLAYGDRRVLEDNYPMIRRWLAFAQSKTRDHLLEPYVSYGIRMPQWNYLGDWVMPRRKGQEKVDRSRDPVGTRLINNLHHLHTLRIAARIARILERPEDAALYDRQAADLARAIHQTFWDEARGVYGPGEQAYLAFPLLLDVTPPALRDRVARTLEETILVKDGGHIDAGMHGTYFLLKTLMELDRNDLVFTMASKTTHPGWGYMLEQGATTIWESWEGASHIHDTLISIGAWFIQGIGGIRVDEEAPGFARFDVKPSPVGDLTFARARFRSPHGEIASAWRISGGRLRLEVTVPPGTTARVFVPGKDAAALGPAAGRPRPVRTEAGRALFEVGAGRHLFGAVWPG